MPVHRSLESTGTDIYHNMREAFLPRLDNFTMGQKIKKTLRGVSSESFTRQLDKELYPKLMVHNARNCWTPPTYSCIIQRNKNIDLNDEVDGPFDDSIIVLSRSF